MTTPSNDFVKANTPESRALDVEGDHFAAHHIGGTTWRFGSGDEALDDRVGTITLAPRGYVNCGLANARWIVHALDQVKQQVRADERRRIDELAILRGYGDFWKVNDDPRKACGVSLTSGPPQNLPTFTEALEEAATTKEGTDQ